MAIIQYDSVQDFQKLPRLGDLVAEIPILSNYLGGNWSVVDNKTNKPICSFDIFIGYEAIHNSNVPSQNIEQGSFASYNKVNNPDEFRVILAKSGYVNELKTMVKALEDKQKSIDLVNIILPYRTFLNTNITDFNHAKTAGDSVNMLVAELTIKEIREREIKYEDGKPVYTVDKIANPSDASTVDRGRVQAQEISLLASIRDKVMK